MVLVGMALVVAVGLMFFSVLHYSAPAVLQALPITKDGRAKGVYATVVTDGSRVYFEEVFAGREIATQVSATGGETAEIPIPTKGTIYDISPDGSRMLFGAEMAGGIQLWLQPLPTGPANRIGDFSAIDAGWAPDGESFVFINNRNVFWAKADGTGVRKIATTEGNAGWPRVSPDGQKIRLTVADPTGSSQTIWEVRHDGSALRPLLRQWFNDGNQCCGRWTNDGKYFIFQNVGDATSDLWVLPERHNPLMGSRNNPIRLTNGPVDFFLPQPSRDGKSIFAIGQQLASELVRYDVHSKAFLPYLGGISATSVVISPDERWAAYVAYPEGTLWRSQVDGSERLKLTESTIKVEHPHWSPDGSQIAFVGSQRGMPSTGFVVSANGGPARKILPDGGVGSLWSNDGTKIAFNYFAPGRSEGDRDWLQIRFMDLANNKTSLVPNSEGLFVADWSRDGKYLLAKTSDHHRGLLFEISTGRWTIVTEAEMLTNLRFSRKGDYAYFESTSAKHAALMRMRVSDHKIEQVMDFQNIRRPLTKLSSAWTGLTDDDSPLMQRDIGTQEVYALHWRVP